MGDVGSVDGWPTCGDEEDKRDGTKTNTKGTTKKETSHTDNTCMSTWTWRGEGDGGVREEGERHEERWSDSR